MTNEEEKLKQFIKTRGIKAEHLHFEQSLHTVQQLLRVTGLPLELITKTMIFTSEKGEKTQNTLTSKASYISRQSVIAAMIPAAFRVSVSRLKEAVGFDVELADAQTSYRLTGYPIGGMPCFINALLVVDPKVLEKEYVYTGGGSEYSIAKIPASEILKMNPLVVRITGKKSN